ncbi:GTPase IMAP family member 8-like [Lampris incognitus]|uniref:GTPase IMAP family member 8-like n=1 Tax=Lampris incognitus TaxID=2546036 RepID=UPI0024B53582|nr:GTPase IMAP family member 8-like [Lampris incognitus]
MEKHLEKEEGHFSLPVVRLILIGGRWAGKSSSGNTILGKERFECGRTRTAQSEVRHEVVAGRELVVVDAPGWSYLQSLSEIPEVDKQQFKLNVSQCPPGPHAFLLVIPIDSAFTIEQRKPLEQHMKLLGERVWRNTMVLFTCGDLLGPKRIEQHIENEGEALRWLVERCGDRYHVFNNKVKNNSSQVTLLLEKIDWMVLHNNGDYYQADEHTLQLIKEKQKAVSERADKRRKKAEEQRQKMKVLNPGGLNLNPELRIVLVGSRNVGKTSVGNTILGIKEQEDGKRTTHSVLKQGYVDKTAIKLVDTPGWWKGFSVTDTTEMIKQEIMSSMFMCPPGPHVFLLVIDADTSFNTKHRDAVTGHLELFGEDVWKHTMMVFTRGDWLGKKTIEQYIEGEGEALQSLVDNCGNRYHVIDNKNTDDGTQVTEMMEKISNIIMVNSRQPFVTDEQIYLVLEEKKKKVEEGAKVRQTNVKSKREGIQGSRNQPQEIRLVLLGEKTAGKSASGNTLLRKEVFAACTNKYCQTEKGEVAGRQVTVTDTPGWGKNTFMCTEENKKEIVGGRSLCSLGIHALLLVIPVDMAFTEVKQRTLQEYMGLFDISVWKYTVVLFTYGDRLADKSVEEYIEREKYSLQWLVDKCENRYHVLNNTLKTDKTQVIELFEKIEEMATGNGNQLFSFDMSAIHQKIQEKSKRWENRHVLQQRLEQEYRRRELGLMTRFRQTLMGLQDEIREKTTKKNSSSGEMAKIKTIVIGHKKKDGKERIEVVENKICQELEKLNMDILRSTKCLWSSKEFTPPDMNGSVQDFDKVLCWLSTLQISRNVEHHLTLNFSEASSGYKSLPSAGYFNTQT